VLSNAWAREIVIPLAEITRRTTMAAPTNGPVVAAASPPSTATNVTVTNMVALAKSVAATNALFSSHLLRNWHGDIQAGVDLTFSERDRQAFHTRAKLTYARQRVKNLIDYNFAYGRSEVDRTVGGTVRQEMVTDANRMNGSMKTDIDITKKWFVYNLGGAGYDEIRKIDLRYEVGPGIGYHLIQWTNFFVNAEAGTTYQFECRSDGTELDRFYGRLAEIATWKISPRLTWDEKLEYLPRIDNPEEFQLRFESNIRYALLQNVFLNLAVIDIYETMPASGVTKNDLQVRSSVGVKF
jgi:hypothetical protein